MIYHTFYKTYLPNMHEVPHTDRTIVMHLAILRVTVLPVAEVARVAAVAAAWCLLYCSMILCVLVYDHWV
jgi:hypothetical protein